MSQLASCASSGQAWRLALGGSVLPGRGQPTGHPPASASAVLEPAVPPLKPPMPCRYHMIVQKADAIFGPAGSAQREDAGAHLLAFLAVYARVAYLDTRDLRSSALVDLGGKAWRWRSVREMLQKWHALLSCNGTLSELVHGWPADQALLTSRQELRGLLVHYLELECRMHGESRSGVR